MDDDLTLDELLRRLAQPKQWKGRRVQALRPPGRGRPLFFPPALSASEAARRRSAWGTRKLRLLRAHGLIANNTGRHRYQLTTPPGLEAITAPVTVLRATVRRLALLAP